MSCNLIESLRSIVDDEKSVSPMDYSMLIHQIASQSRITEEILNELRNMRCILNRKGNYIYPHEALMSKTDSFNDDRFLDDILGRQDNITKTFTIGKMTEHQYAKLVIAGVLLDITIPIVFV